MVVGAQSAAAEPMGHGLIGQIIPAKYTPWGLVGNLAKGVERAAIGLGPGIVHGAEHPIGAVQGIAKSEAQTWGPLVHGDVNTFLKQLYEQPLGPVLDVAALWTGGGALAGKAAVSHAGHRI